MEIKNTLHLKGIMLLILVNVISATTFTLTKEMYLISLGNAISQV